jgi:glycosyltransferase involved in cell wall biosynthesis
LKLALVHDWLTGMRGGEKCLEVLCRNFPDAQLYTLFYTPGSTSPAIEGREIKASPLNRLPQAERWRRYALPLYPWAIEQFELPADIDLVVSLSHAVAKGIRPPPGVPHLCYCFTPMRYAWDLRREYFAPPRSYWPHRGIDLAREAALDRLQAWDRRVSDRVTRFIAISGAIQDRIRRAYDRESEVLYPPVDVDLYTPAAIPREDFYLVVSALTPYKRIDLAVDACRQLGRKLVVIGAGPERQTLARRAGPLVSFLGWQSDAVIRDHYRRCRALLFPGIEDFGIVPVEAQACGAPVIAMGQGGALETIRTASRLRPGSGVFFDEATAEDLAGAIRWFESHPRQFSPSVARGQALQFAGERFERGILELVESTARGETRRVPVDAPMLRRAA